MKYKNRVQEIALGVGLYISSARHTAQRGFVSAGLLKLGFFSVTMWPGSIYAGEKALHIGSTYIQYRDQKLRENLE